MLKERLNKGLTAGEIAADVGMLMLHPEIVGQDHIPTRARRFNRLFVLAGGLASASAGFAVAGVAFRHRH